MARKNKPKPTKYQGIKELEMSDGTLNYVAVFSHNGTRHGEKNLTKLYGVKSAKQAFEKLSVIRNDLSKGIDVFGTKSDKVDYLVTEYLNTRNKDYRKNSTATYNKHIKPIIGHMKIAKVKKEHLIKIRTNMEEMGLSPNTIKKPKIILSPVFKEAFADEVTHRNVLEPIKFGEDRPKPPLVDRVDEPLINAARKIYYLALKEEADYNAVFLTSIMCARRLGEILAINYEDIIDGVVHVRASTTKTYKKLHPNAVAEKFPLPKEVLDIIGTGTGKIFKHYSRTYMDKYATMMKTKADIKLKPLAEDYPLRSHDNRNFIISIQSEKFGIDTVGAACLSHSNRSSNMNARYHSMEFHIIKEIYEDYWKKLRAQPTKTFAQNAIEEQLKELSKESEVN